MEGEGRRVRLVPLPVAELVERTYETTLSAAQLDSILAAAPPGAVHVEAGRVALRGTPDEHQRLQELLVGMAGGQHSGSGRTRAPDRTAGKTVLTLQVTNQPVEAILRALEKQAGLQVRWDETVAERVRTRVTFDVREATLEELLEAALTPAKLTYRRDGNSLTIIPAQ